MGEIKSLFLTLKEPAKIHLANEDIVDAPLVIDGLTTSRPSTPPWPACADILIDTHSHLFVGLCYRVSKEFHSAVRGFCSHLSPNIVLYNDLTAVESKQLYGEFGDSTHWVEIKWSTVPPNRVEVVQLDSGFWYYIDNWGRIDAVAFGLEGLDEIMRDYDLILPKLTSFPAFDK
jgi:hypothetical protein